MVNFGEFLQAEVERPEAKHTRVFFVDYHALKERLYEIDEGGAASFEVSLGVQLTSKETTTKPTSSHNPVVKFLGLIDAEFEKVNKYVESKTKSMLVALTHMRDGAVRRGVRCLVLSPSPIRLPPPERCTAPKLHSSEVIIECLEVDLAGGRAHGARSVTPVHTLSLIHI